MVQLSFFILLFPVLACCSRLLLFFDYTVTCAWCRTECFRFLCVLGILCALVYIIILYRFWLKLCGLSVVSVIWCVVSCCGAMASTDAMMGSMGTAPVDCPTAPWSLPLPGGGHARLRRMVGDAATMHSLLPADRRLEAMQTFGDLLDDDMMGRLLRPSILRDLRLEFDRYRPMLDVLNGYMSTGLDYFITKDRDQVARAAGVVYDWVCRDGCAVLGFLDVLSYGLGTSYSAAFLLKVHRFSNAVAAIDPTRLHQDEMAHLCSHCGCRYRVDVVCYRSQYISTMVARLCRDARAVGEYSFMLDDSVAAQTGTFAGYRQLNAGGVGGSSMDPQ